MILPQFSMPIHHKEVPHMNTTAIPETPAPTKKSSPKRTKGKQTPAKKQKMGPVAKAWDIFAKHPRAAREDAVPAVAASGRQEVGTRSPIPTGTFYKGGTPWRTSRRRTVVGTRRSISAGTP